MTKEELEKKTEESFDSYKVTDEDYVVSPYSDDMGEKMLMYNNEYYAEETYLRFYKQGYLAGAEPREKRIEELEKEHKELREKVHFWKKEVRVTERARDDEFDKIIIENRTLKKQLSKLKNDLNEAKGYLQKLLSNDPVSESEYKDLLSDADYFLEYLSKEE